jgi:hypothetical protein
MVTGHINTQTSTQANKTTQSFVMVKNVEGALSVNLDAHDFSTPTKTFRFRFNQERQHVPAKWAIGTFVSSGALTQMETGFFTYENLAELIKVAEEMGYYVPDSIKEPRVDIKDIRKALLNDDRRALDSYIMNMTTKTRNDILSVARKLYDKLNTGTIEFLEKRLAVSLKTADLSAQ